MFPNMEQYILHVASMYGDVILVLLYQHIMEQPGIIISSIFPRQVISRDLDYAIYKSNRLLHCGH